MGYTHITEKWTRYKCSHCGKNYSKNKDVEKKAVNISTGLSQTRLCKTCLITLAIDMGCSIEDYSREYKKKILNKMRGSI